MLKFDELLTTGYEVVQEQTDKDFIFTINSILGNVTNDLNIMLKGRDVLKHGLSKTTILQLKQQYKLISDILTDRFNFNIKVKHTKENTVIHSMYPNYTYNNVINAVTDFKKMYPTKDNLFYNITTDDLTKQAINGMDNLQQAINQDNLTIDLKNAKIYGLEDTTMNIFINIKQVIHKELTPNNIIALMLKEIGNFFTDIYKINNILDNNLGIISDIKALDMEKTSPDKLKIVLDKHIGTKIDGDTEVAILESFNSIYVQEMTNRLDSDNYDEDSFVTKFNLGSDLATTVLKIHTDKSLTRYDGITWDIVKMVFILLIIYVLFFTLLILNVFVGIGVILMLGVQAILLLLGVCYKIGVNMFKFLFNSGGEVVDVDNVVKEITSIKRSLISNLRNKNIDKADTTTQIQQVDKVLDSLRVMYRFDTTLRSKHKLHPTDYSYIEKLSNNDLHYLSETLK